MGKNKPLWDGISMGAVVLVIAAFSSKGLDGKSVVTAAAVAAGAYLFAKVRRLEAQLRELHYQVLDNYRAYRFHVNVEFEKLHRPDRAADPDHEYPRGRRDMLAQWWKDLDERRSADRPESVKMPEAAKEEED